MTLGGVFLFAITELLSNFELLQRGPLWIMWLLAVGCGALFLLRRRLQVVRPASFDPFVLLCATACFVVVFITGATAFISPPNSADAMAYHMPRVIYWAEQASVRFFPTPYLNQIMLQPLTEYAMLHLYLLSGGDQFVNLIQWFASAISIIAVSLAAGLFGANARGQAIAALFCATLPAGVLASSGAKNDYALAMWMIVAVCFAIRFASTSAITDALFLGAACGLAFLTKATGYIFLPLLIGAIFLARWRPTRSALTAGVAAAFLALAISTPHYIRNYALSGSVLGFDSAQGDGLFRWRNESFGWRQTISNVMRNGSEQLGARSDRWNQRVYYGTLAIHKYLSIDPNDEATTWRWSKFVPPKNANHEADSPNRWHLVVLAVVAGILFWRAIHGHDRERAFYLVAMLVGFIAFCAYLKWQPFMARLFLPLFVAAAPLAGIAGELPKKIGLLIQVPLCLLLLDNARLPLLQNWVRPLTGRSSMLRVNRDDLYFADMTPWNNKDSFFQSADLVIRSGCATIGIDIHNFQLEYPLMALVRQRNPTARFVHTAVMNPSRSYRQPVEGAPCVIVCLDCAGDTSRLKLYEQFPKVSTFGKFVVLAKE